LNADGVPSPGKVILVRHTEVARAWAGRCYGQSDMGLSREGARAARALAGTLLAAPPNAIVHSGLKRTRLLAQIVARATGLTPIIDPRWRERSFGDWEGRSWNAIWRATGDAMDRIMTEPERFRPGGAGETGAELAARCLAAWDALPREGTTLVIAHGGAIATIRALAHGADLTQAAQFIPKPGKIVPIPRPLRLAAHAAQHHLAINGSAPQADLPRCIGR